MELDSSPGNDQGGITVAIVTVSTMSPHISVGVCVAWGGSLPALALTVKGSGVRK